MKKLLIASTALSLAGGAAFAEMAITVSGDAEMGVDYASEPAGGASKHSFVHEVGIDFEGSGTTDGGLTFGGSAGFDTGDDVVNTGTVHVSGSFGKLTIGDNDAADLTAGGVAQIGMNDIGVDDMVEGLRGTTAAALRYDNSFGQIKIAISAGTKDGSAAVAAVPASGWRITDHDMKTRYYWPNYTVDSKGVSRPDPAVSNVPGSKIVWDSNREMYVGSILQMAASPVSNFADNDGTLVDGFATNIPAPTNELDTLFGVISRVKPDTASNISGQVWVDLDGSPKDDNDAVIEIGDKNKAPVNIYGYSRSEDGTKILDAAGKAVAADSDAAEAFTRYEANYDLGTDKKVGGEDGKTSATLAADTIKVASNAKAAVPAVASDSEYAFGMSFNAGGVTIGVGYDSNKTVSMGAGFTTGEITTNLLYVKTEDDNATPADEEMTGMGVDMAYTMGASKVTLAYGRRKPETGEAMDAVGMDVEHDLGGDATLKAGFGKVDKKVGTMIVSENKASIGLMFAF